jgi:hypothetical protein
MYNTFLEVLLTAREKFSEASNLGIDKSFNVPTYSPYLAKNGIGCAIGCLLDPDTAHKVQNTCKTVELYAIKHIFTISDFDGLFNCFNISDSLTINELKILQKTHDFYTESEFNEFIVSLDRLIELVGSELYAKNQRLFELILINNINVIYMHDKPVMEAIKCTTEYERN